VLDVGRDSISAIAPEYQDQDKFEFTGQIEQVTFALK
jgi:arylsulfatase